MKTVDVNAFPAGALAVIECQPWHQSRDRHASRVPGTYRDDVPDAKADPRVQMFARFVHRALDEAQDRGMSITEVEDRTGLSRSTMYRWRRAETSSPQREQVLAFCAGLGIPTSVAGKILGWDGERQPTEPEPSVDPDLRAVMRKLNSPSTSTEEKTIIRATLRHLAKGG